MYNRYLVNNSYKLHISMCPRPLKEARFFTSTLLPWGGGGKFKLEIEIGATLGDVSLP